MSSSNYLSEVSDLFLQRRGRSLNLSPLDWQTISEWESSGIPLHVVCRAINDVFNKYDEQPKAKQSAIKSISYCAEAIEAGFEDWCKLQVGR
ncbi:MAG: hypothetical protein M3Q99_16825 [Acidobacteriota bacterium]|nr:hypothetical protein [Acidobacteriota bacterium]